MTFEIRLCGVGGEGGWACGCLLARGVGLR